MRDLLETKQSKLEAQKRRERCVIMIQCLWRLVVAKREAQRRRRERFHRSVVTIQVFLRYMIGFRKRQKLRCAARVIQRAFREVSHKWMPQGSIDVRWWMLMLRT
jgi:hypothetical protein